MVVVEKNPSLHVVSIGLNRPEKRNCVNEETAAALAEAFLDFEQDEEMRCAVLHGFGGNFCAGYDLEELSRLTDEERPNRLASMLERGPMVRDAVQYFFANYCTIVCHRLFSDLVPGGHMGPVTEGRFIIWRALRYLKIRISSLLPDQNIGNVEIVRKKIGVFPLSERVFTLPGPCKPARRPGSPP